MTFQKSRFIEKYRARPWASDIIAVFSTHLSTCQTHYHDSCRTFYCTGVDGKPGKVCCARLGKPRQGVVIPIVHYTPEDLYTPDDLQDLRYGSPVTAKFLNLTASAYTSTLARVASNTDLDLQVLCDDPEFQRLRYRVLGKALWRKDEEIRISVHQQAQVYKQLIWDSVARTLTDEDIDTLLGESERSR